MKRVLISLLLFLFSLTAFPQFHPLGLNPPSLDWKQIDTEKVQVIFPETSTRQAQRVANIIHHLYDSSYYSLGDRKKKVSIILQNQTTISNGFVTVGPFRSEFYVNAPQVNFSGTTDWIDLLTIHEYRHVEQFTNAKKGLTKFGSIIFGQNGWGLFAGLALPRWFFEGDAVYYETMLTNGGRGRMPEFQNEYRALLLSGREFGYEKASATSLREFVPNHYTLGYFMTTSLRRQFGAHTWEPVVSDAVSYKGLLYPFNRSMRKRLGIGSPELYQKTMEELENEWEKEAEQLDLTPFQKLNFSKKKTFTNYRYPTFIDSNSIMVERSGFNEIPTFYELDLNSGSFKKLLKPGIYMDGNATLDYENHLSTWSQLAYDSRWGNKNYSIIMLNDHRSSKKRKLTTDTRYFAPDLSDDLRIAAIHSPADQEFELHILDSNTGRVTGIFKSERNDKIAFPTWVSKNEIAVIITRNSKNAIGIIDLLTNEMKAITPFWDDQISYLTYKNNHLFFSGTFTGIDNIFSLDLGNLTMYQITSSKFGATQPDISPDFKKIVYSDYTAEGYDVVITDLDPERWREFSGKSPTPIDYFKPLQKEGGSNILADVPSKDYTVENFNTKSGLVNIHSWTPNFVPPNFGVIVSADNKLSTFSADASATYNRNEETITYGLDIAYGEHEPVYDLNYNFSRRNRYVPLYEELAPDPDSVLLNTATQSWDENNISLGMTLPYNLTDGNFFSRFWIAGRYHQIWVDYDDPMTGTDESFGAIDFEVDIYAIRRTARQHINPRLGFTLNTRYQSTLLTNANSSNYFIVRNTTFLPGLMRNHSFYINASYQSEPFTSQYKFQDNFFYARGHDAVVHDRIWKIGFNYALPLFYPDLPVGPFFFFQRVKAAFFYDYSQASRDATAIEDLTPITGVSFRGSLNRTEQVYESIGVELTTDFRFLRVLDIDMGVRYSYLLNDNLSLNRNQFDLLVLSIGY